MQVPSRVVELLQRVTLDCEIPTCPAKLFDFCVQVQISYLIILPSPFHLLHRHQILMTVWRFSLPSSVPLSFYPSQTFFQHIFGTLSPPLILLTRGTNTERSYTSEEIISRIKDRSVEIFQSESQRKKWLKGKRTESASVT